VRFVRSRRLDYYVTHCVSDLTMESASDGTLSRYDGCQDFADYPVGSCG
jgi:hypothetical protein